MSNQYTIKYPKDIVSVVRKQTLSITAELVKPNLSEGDSPLKFYNEHFSRFPFTIINEQKKFANANIPVREIPNIIKRSCKAYDVDMERTLMPVPTQPVDNGQNSQQNNSAFTVQIASGMFKGKTPAQVLLENPNNLDALGKQFEWLKSNLGKNPKYETANKRQMVAIKEAKTLFVAGKLKQSDNGQQSAQHNQQNFQSFVIYDSGFRPKTRKTRSDGMSFVYSIKIAWNFGNNYPVTIEIFNYYAPVVKNNNGLLNVQFANRDQKSEIRNVMKLSAAEWENILYMMQVNMRTFENNISAEMRKASDDASFQNAQSAKAQNTQQNNQTVSTPVRAA